MLFFRCWFNSFHRMEFVVLLSCLRGGPAAFYQPLQWQTGGWYAAKAPVWTHTRQIVAICNPDVSAISILRYVALCVWAEAREWQRDTALLYRAGQQKQVPHCQGVFEKSVCVRLLLPLNRAEKTFLVRVFFCVCFFTCTNEKCA